MRGNLREGDKHRGCIEKFASQKTRVQLRKSLTVNLHSWQILRKLICMKSIVSMENIAQRAGVTRATVSLALRNHPRISEATRRKIRSLAEEMGYRPDPEMERLMTRVRQGRETAELPVMVLVTDFAKPLAEHSPTSATWRGFIHRAEELGYAPQEMWRTPDLTGARVARILRARGVRGVVFSALQDTRWLLKMDISCFACAQIGNVIRRPLMSRCTSDKYHNTIIAAQELWRLGCRRLALIVPKGQEERVEHTFLSGYLVFHHLHHHSGWKFPLVNESAWNGQRIAKWVAQHRPDGIIAAYPGLENALRETLGDTIPLTAVVNVETPEQAGINQRHEAIAAGAVDLVDAQLRRNITGALAEPKTLLVRGIWQPAASNHL